MPAFIRYGLKQFTASLGRNVFSIWMAVCFSPFLKPEHGGIVLQNEVELPDKPDFLSGSFF